MSTNYFNIKPLQYDLFVEMDVDKSSISITVVNHEGELLQRTPELSRGAAPAATSAGAMS